MLSSEELSLNPEEESELFMAHFCCSQPSFMHSLAAKKNTQILMRVYSVSSPCQPVKEPKNTCSIISPHMLQITLSISVTSNSLLVNPWRSIDIHIYTHTEFVDPC